MPLLLDSHAFLWWKLDDRRLPQVSRLAIAEDEAVYLSVATVWELAIKVGIGKLPEAADSVAELASNPDATEFPLLSITPKHAVDAGLLDIAHRDPFDRLLICQTRSERLTLVSNERLFDQFAVDRLWD
jgi:PIN domain nuclease of toxin-antitoxin system